MRIAAATILILLAGGGASLAQQPDDPAATAIDVHTVRPVLETPNLPDNTLESDGDDPAVWIHPKTARESLVVTAVKDGGIRVYDLSGSLKQTILPREHGKGVGRINNVDVAYGLRLKDGRRVDIVVASDRGLDVIRIYEIDGNAAQPLKEITARPFARAFPERPKTSGAGLEANPLRDQNTAYGLALWKTSRGRVVVVATQRSQPRLGEFELTPVAGGKVDAVFVRDFIFPDVHDGQDLRIESETDPRQDWSPQFEGLVVDQRTGILYAGQEDVGIWRVDLSTGKADGRPFYETRGAPGSSFHEPKSVIARDVEGLTIYYGPHKQGYLLASSQGGAHGDEADADPPYDDSFVVFDLHDGQVPDYRGSFRVGKKGGIDAVQESDGAEVISTGLPGFPDGLFITQDGYDDDLDGLSGEVDSSNFKYVDWAAIARSFDPPLMITPNAYDPRK